MSDQEDQPQTIPSLRETGKAMSEEEERRQSSSPEAGHPAGETEPPGGAEQEGRRNAEATPDIADDAEEGQTTFPAPPDDPDAPRN
jgi:hypothetical protein